MGFFPRITKKKKMKFLVLASVIALTMAGCPDATEDNTLISGSMPVPVNPSWMKPMECAGLKNSFQAACGSADDRPTCVCANGDSWLHPYWIGQCAAGGNPEVCTCPNGAHFPVASFGNWTLDLYSE